MARLSSETIACSAAALQAGDVQEALAIRNREFQQEGGSFDDSIARTIGFILSRTPALLADCPPSVIEPLRIAAALLELWGESSIKRFVTIEDDLDYRFGIDAIAHMLHSHGSYLSRLEDIKSTGITHVSLLSAGDTSDCAACKAINGKKWTIQTVPEVPLLDCKCENRYGCRVVVVATVDDN